MSEKFGGEILRKYAKIDIFGRKAIKQKSIIEHKNFPESLKNRLNFSVCFNENSIERLDENLISKLRSLENYLGIKMIIAGRDFPLHSTILEGLFESKINEPADDADKRKNNIFSEIINDQEFINNLIKKLSNQNIDFKYLLIDKETLILTADEIPEAILEIRKKLEEKYKDKKLKPLLMENILHMTISKITQLPDDEENLEKYKKEIINLRHEVSANPLTLTIENINIGNSYEFINQLNK